MKISLLYPQWTGGYGLFSHFAKRAATWPPLNLCYLGALAERKGHNVSIIDGQAERICADEVVRRTVAYGPDLIGITSTTPFHHVSRELAGRLKAAMPEIPVVIGGPHVTVLREEAFDSCFDYAFIGESDASWPEFLDAVEQGTAVGSVKGLLYRENGAVKFTGDALRAMDLDAIPVPGRHLLRMDRYRIGTLDGTKRFTTIMTMRGCPFRCIFCSTEVFGRVVRKRKPACVLEEMQSVIEAHGVQHFMFMDDTLTLDRGHIMDICRGMIDRGFGVTFEGSTRANLVDEELVATMREAGLIRLSFGLESVDDNVRTLMRKEVPLESYIEANRLTNKHGIETLNSCMIGLPGDTKETIRKTLAFLRRSREIKQANISIAVPYPGTELMEMARSGRHDLRLVTDDFAAFRRYNAAVMSVGSLSPADLIRLQNDAFVSIYIVPWRWKSVLKKSGILGLLLTFSRLVKSLLRGKIEFVTNRQLGLS